MNEECVVTEPEQDVATRLNNEIKYLYERIKELESAREVLVKNPDVAQIVQALRYL